MYCICTILKTIQKLSLTFHCKTITLLNGLWEPSPIWKFATWILMSLFHLFKHNMLYFMTLEAMKISWNNHNLQNHNIMLLQHLFEPLRFHLCHVKSAPTQVFKKKGNLQLVGMEHGMYMDVVTYNYMFIPYLYIIFCVKFAYFQMPYF